MKKKKNLRGQLFFFKFMSPVKYVLNVNSLGSHLQRRDAIVIFSANLVAENERITSRDQWEIQE